MGASKTLKLACNHFLGHCTLEVSAFITVSQYILSTVEEHGGVYIRLSPKCEEHRKRRVCGLNNICT